MSKGGNVRILAVAFLISSFSFCNQSKFSGNGDYVTSPNQVSKDFSLTCDEKTGVRSEEASLVYTEETQVTVKIQGSFCPLQTDRLIVLFLIDFSGSMGRHRPETNQPIINGNDPQINGSCGRLEAAKAIVQKIVDEKRGEDRALIAMIPFAGEVLNARAIKPLSLSKFQEKLTKDYFCQYVVQDESFGYDPENPGGIDGTAYGLDSATNYTAIFQSAERVMSGVSGRKVTYFISDGEPTRGGEDPLESGIEAGQHFRNQFGDLTLNTLLLGDQSDTKAYDVLEQIAGGSDRVRVALKANELASEIVKFPETIIDERTGHALFKLSTGETENIPLSYFRKDGPSKWSFETAPFLLIGNGKEEVINQIVVQAKDQNGVAIESVLSVKFVKGEKITKTP